VGLRMMLVGFLPSVGVPLFTPSITPLRKGKSRVANKECTVPSKPSTLEEQRRNKTSKHQAVFSLDYATWQSLIEAFEIREPLIEHRLEDAEARAARMGERGWYT
jgi:hypothetical protein